MDTNICAVIHTWFNNKHLFNVSMVVGKDLRPRLQITRDHSMTHLELYDRPDGHRPNQCLTYYKYVQTLYRQKRKERQVFTLTDRHTLQLEIESSLFLMRALVYLHLGQTRLAEKDLLFVLSCLGFVIKKSKRPGVKKSFKRYYDAAVLIYQKAQSTLALEQGESERANLFHQMAANSLQHLFETADQHAPCLGAEDLHALGDFIHENVPTHRPAAVACEKEFALDDPTQNVKTTGRPAGVVFREQVA